ncbi:glucose-6-phosphate isomerase, partial [Mesorhizobium sp. M8A.F.Ca.ET.173.01.1.1]
AFRNSNEYPEIVFVGNHLSSTYTQELIHYLDGKDFSVNVISKSGTTTEPAVSFRLFKQILENKYGKEEAKQRIFATTDKEKGALKQLATNEG